MSFSYINRPGNQDPSPPVHTAFSKRMYYYQVIGLLWSILISWFSTPYALHDTAQETWIGLGTSPPVDITHANLHGLLDTSR